MAGDLFFFDYPCFLASPVHELFMERKDEGDKGVGPIVPDDARGLPV